MANNEKKEEKTLGTAEVAAKLKVTPKFLRVVLRANAKKENEGVRYQWKPDEDLSKLKTMISEYEERQKERAKNAAEKEKKAAKPKAEKKPKAKAKAKARKAPKPKKEEEPDESEGIEEGEVEGEDDAEMMA